MVHLELVVCQQAHPVLLCQYVFQYVCTDIHSLYSCRQISMVHVTVDRPQTSERLSVLVHTTLLLFLCSSSSLLHCSFFMVCKSLSGSCSLTSRKSFNLVL